VFSEPNPVLCDVSLRLAAGLCDVFTLSVPCDLNWLMTGVNAVVIVKEGVKVGISTTVR